MPYFVPACAFSTIGISTIRLPRKMVRTDCHQFIPPLTSDEASWYVGMQADIEIHSAAIDHTDQFRWYGVVGARSAFHSGEDERSSLQWAAAESGAVAVIIGGGEAR